MNIIKRIRKLFRMEKRLELRFLSYREANDLLQASPDAWRIAREEDTNTVLGMAFIERIEPL